MKYLKLEDVNNYLGDLDLPLVTKSMMCECEWDVIDFDGVEMITTEDFVYYYPEAIAMNDMLSKVVSRILI